MVRLKHRYLLVQILSPSSPTSATHTNAPLTSIPPKDSIRSSLNFHAPLPSSLTPQLLLRSLKDSISTHYGAYGLGLTAPSLAIKYLSPLTATVIVRVARKYVRIVWGALTFLTELDIPLHPIGSGPSSKAASRVAKRNEAVAREVVMQVVRCSGTIRKIQEEVVRRAKALISAAKLGLEAGDDGPTGRLKGLLADVSADNTDAESLNGHGGAIAIMSDGGSDGEEGEENEEDDDRG